MRAVVVLLVLLTAAGAVAGAVERVARSQVEAAVRQALPGLSQDAEVEVGGDLVLPQLVRGRLREVGVTASGLTLDLSGAAAASSGGAQAEPGDAGSGGTQGPAAATALATLELEDVSGQVTGVGLGAPRTASSLSATGTVPWSGITGLLDAALEDALPEQVGGAVPGPVVSEGSAGALEVSVTVLGVRLSGEAVPSLSEDGSLVLTLRGAGLLEVLGAGPSVTVVEAQALPAGLRLAAVEAGEDGVRVEVTGEDVDLAALGA